eukprot:scaffold957_cov125-Skeletonema_dohrnii-CCMP3373.AAC.4
MRPEIMAATSSHAEVVELMLCRLSRLVAASIRCGAVSLLFMSSIYMSRADVGRSTTKYHQSQKHHKYHPRFLLAWLI